MWTIPEFCLSQETRRRFGNFQNCPQILIPGPGTSAACTGRMLYVDLDILMTRQPTEPRGRGEVAAAKKTRQGGPSSEIRRDR
jgi:hypothetical protein